MNSSIETSDIAIGAAHPSARLLPFAGVVGHAKAKLALMLLAVDPRLKGALIASGPGTGKSTLARGLESVWPDRLTDDRDDLAPRSMIVELPLNATADRLLGSLDLDRTLASGRRHMSEGLLARAHGRVLYVDDVNLMEPGIAHLVAAALDAGAVRVERDGFSTTSPAEFVLVGTYNPEEGEVSAALRDRVGLIVEADALLSTDARSEIISRTCRFDDDLVGFIEEFSGETAAIRSAISEARRSLATVRLSKSRARKLAEAALALSVEGNRADIFAVRAARASAALRGRKAASEDDLNAAIDLVLIPRAAGSHSPERRLREADRSPPRDREDNESRRGDEPDSPAEPADSDAAQSTQDVMIKPAEAAIPKGALAVSPSKRGRVTSGRRATAATFTSGRYIGSTDRRPKAARVSVDATLRAAAPFQLSRRAAKASSARDVGTSVQGETRQRAAQNESPRRIIIKPDDLRYKKFKRRSGMLFIFVVDASGSMALNRMAQAKGAMLRLLNDAYLHRDSVALVAFRGASANVLLPPTRSVALAKQVVDALPAGGGTPIAAGLIRALELARMARSRDGSQSALLLFTDGRANVGVNPRHSNHAAAIKDELREIGSALRLERIDSIVIDTRHEFVSSGEGRALGELLGARYCYLPRADSGMIYRTIASAARGVRRNDG